MWQASQRAIEGRAVRAQRQRRDLQPALSVPDGQRGDDDFEQRGLARLVQSRQPEQAAELAELAARYAPARSTRGGRPFSLAYRLRLLFLDRWNLWGRLTRYTQLRSRCGPPLARAQRRKARWHEQRL
jgi:hypothetical protein